MEQLKNIYELSGLGWELNIFLQFFSCRSLPFSSFSIIPL